MKINKMSYEQFENQPKNEKMKTSKDTAFNKEVRRQSKAARQARKNARGRFWS